ncbi:murein biosynthesis integral membrane protein MurJ [Modestobacter marinus]|uniref:murein biosynthesis integral membrane protein MurJ n=1 Tax=Modestobacter marinus TaxID=477641 RepID=UPI001C976AC8|nr:murein biosynthesis integral membrane protein MurJ [Modestobacter marinus]
MSGPGRSADTGAGPDTGTGPGADDGAPRRRPRSPTPLPPVPYKDPPPAAGQPGASSARPGLPRYPATGGAPMPPLPGGPLRPVPPSADAALRRAPLPPVPPSRVRRFVPGPDDTQLIPVLPPVPQDDQETAEDGRPRTEAPGGSRGILRAAGTMAVATAVSRLTGLLRTVVIAAALGVGLVNDAYNTANTLPNLVYELLLGGVLSSVVVPLLVQAQERDRDGGVGYAQRLITLATAGLAAMTAVAVLAAPLLTRLSGISGDPDQVALANWLARLLLVEIVFYGIGALATAVLNSRGVFGAPAWAPVLNNVVVIATGLLFIAASGPGDLTPVTITSGQVWLLGIGTTLGIAVQALVLLPLLGRAGVPLRPRWGLRGTGLGEVGSLGLWVVGYAAISQVGVIVALRVANAAGRDDALGSSAFAIASLLFQMPYGIIGVALLTALLPRMSRAAARHDTPGVVADLTLGTRLSATGLLPVTALLVVLGPALATVALARGNTSTEDARGIGLALAVGAFGLLPMAMTLLQLRVFYAMKDARTPTLIQLVMVAVRTPLLLLVPVVVADQHVVAGLMVVTSTTYVVGWVAGSIALSRVLGVRGNGAAIGTVVRMAAVSLVAGALGWGATAATERVVGDSLPGSLATVVLGTVVIGVAVLAGAVVAGVPEVRGAWAGVRARLGRSRSS